MKNCERCESWNTKGSCKTLYESGKTRTYHVFNAFVPRLIQMVRRTKTDSLLSDIVSHALRSLSHDDILNWNNGTKHDWIPEYQKYQGYDATL